MFCYVAIEHELRIERDIHKGCYHDGHSAVVQVRLEEQTRYGCLARHYTLLSRTDSSL